jgi:exopolysaccharide production protein ExoZ
MLNNIQLLRAFAALNVVLFHIFKSSSEYSYPVAFFSFIKSWGANGVDIFFVISGFIMFYIQNKKKRSPTMFFKDRFFRIVPLYWSLTLFLALILWLMPNIFTSMSFSIEGLLKSLSFTSILIYKEIPILFVGWTLEYEMLFYALFSLSLFAKSQLKSFIITVILISFAAFYFNLIMLEFIFGMLACWLYLKNKCSQNVALGCFLLGSFLLILSIWIRNLDALINTSEFLRVALWGIPSALIVYGAVNSRQLNNRCLLALGNASYSIYLIQIFTIPAFYKIVKWLNISILNNHIIAILCLATTAYSGHLLHTYYEKRIASLVNLGKH